MELRAFACIVGLSVFVAECVLRYALAKQAAKAEAALESVLRAEFRRLEDEVGRLVQRTVNLAVEQRAEQVDAMPEHQNAHESMLDVGRLIDAERDAQRAQRGLHHLHIHNEALSAYLDASVTMPSRTRMMLVHGLLFCIGLGAGGLAMGLVSR